MLAKTEKQIFYFILRLALEQMTTPTNEPVAYVIDRNALLYNVLSPKPISIKSSRVDFVTDICTSRKSKF